MRCHRFGNWREVGFVGPGRVVIEESLIVAWDLLRILNALSLEENVWLIEVRDGIGE